MSESKQTVPPASYGDEIDLRELFRVLWAGKWLIGGITFVAAVISVIVALMLPNIYRSEALLAVDSEGAGGLAGIAAQYGGLASLAGISLPSAGSSEKTIGIETLQSRQFVGEFVEKHQILPELMASESYDFSADKVTFDSDIYDSEVGTWVREVDPPFSPQPSAQEAFEKFREIFTVNEDIDTGFLRISVEHLSPIAAKNWVTWIVEDINEKMMTQAMSEAQQSIDFLTEQLQKTQVMALQRVFYTLIEEQTKTIMLASVRPEYLFKTIDPAVVMEKRARPNRALICILGTLLGGMLMVAFVLVRYYSFGSRPGAR